MPDNDMDVIDGINGVYRRRVGKLE